MAGFTPLAPVKDEVLQLVQRELARRGDANLLLHVLHDERSSDRAKRHALWALDQGCPGLNVFEYALDVALPLINLGQDTYCRFAPEGPWRWVWSLLHSFYVLVGTALSAVVVLTLTGVLRRD